MSTLDVAQLSEINIIMSKPGNNFNMGYGPGGQNASNHGHTGSLVLLLVHFEGARC